MSSTPITPEERDALAAEYALGLLEGEELARATALVASDADFRDQVERWSGRLAPMLDEVGEVAAPDAVWSGIERRTGGRAASNDNDAALSKRLNLWRGLAAGASALAASLAVVLVTQPSQPTQVQAPAPMVAMLGEERAGTKMVANWNPEGHKLVIAVVADMPGAPGHVHELWVIPGDGRPRSLGMMPAAPHMQMAVSPDLVRQLQQGATLAVSVEPTGGSPTGLPTGPVVASGKLETA